MAFDESARLIWALSATDLGTTISAAGNSGTPATGQPTQSAVTPVDLRRADDLALFVNATGGAGTNLKVQVNLYDDQFNLYQYITGTTPLLGVTVAASPGQAVAFAGRHGGGGSGNYIIPSEWGQVAWTISGSMTGVEIALYAR